MPRNAGDLPSASAGASVFQLSASASAPSQLQPGLLTVAFVLLSLATRLPDPFWIIGLLRGFVLVPIQNQVARINMANGLGVGKEMRFSGINICWLVISSLRWLLVRVGMFWPDVG